MKNEQSTNHQQPSKPRTTSQNPFILEPPSPHLPSHYIVFINAQSQSVLGTLRLFGGGWRGLFSGIKQSCDEPTEPGMGKDDEKEGKKQRPPIEAEIRRENELNWIE
jgi:hypothetical protein